MNAIDFLKDEHRNVERILEILKSMSYKVLNNNLEDYSDFFIVVDCIRNYADGIHHKKEEDMLFKVMVEKLPEAIRKTIQFGMLVEHDQGRMFVAGIEKHVELYMSGLDNERAYIIANALGYVSLLERHIDKEDNVVFKFGQNHLDEESKLELNKLFENQITLENSNYYIEKIEFLEKKYI